VAQVKTLPIQLPTCLQALKIPMRWGLEKDFFQVVSYGKEASAYDPWDMRAEYQRLSEGDDEAALAFLNEYGFHDAPHIISALALAEDMNRAEIRRMFDNFRYFDASDGPHLVYGIAFPLLKELFWSTRRVIRKQMGTAAKVGRPTYEARLTDTSYRTPAVVLTTFSVMDALFATIQIDRFCKARFKKCRRPDCDVIFSVSPTETRKKFCCQYCGHLESVRRGRRNR
jgi:hypothetical protein